MIVAVAANPLRSPYAAPMVLSIVAAALMASTVTEIQPSVVVVEGEHLRVEVRAGERVDLVSPTEGLWSIATAWKEGWPAEWRHAHPTKVSHEGDWTVVSGELPIELPSGNGTLQLRDAYRVEGELLRGRRRFEWHGEQPLDRCTLSVRWVATEAADVHPFLPGISFYGNPSGARTSGVRADDPASAGRAAVVVQAGRAGERSYFEEHRYPIPFASIEWGHRGVALHTTPSLVPGAHRRDQWWSLGMTMLDRGCELSLLSGPCAANGRNAVAKARQGEFMTYDETWLTLRPGAVVEKEFALQLFDVSAPGHGFRMPLRSAIARGAPYSCDGLPSIESIVKSKLAFARSRWREREKDPGFEMYPDFVEGTHYVMGWCGQAETLPFTLLALGERSGWDDAEKVAKRSLDLLVQAPFNENGFLERYTAETGAWSEQDFVSQGQALETITRALEIAQRRGIDCAAWESFVRRAAALHAERVMKPEWRPVSTNEAFFASPLLRAARLLKEPAWAEAGLRIATVAADRHIGYDEPYWGGTLDARCEDKEGAWAAFQAFLAAYDHTNSRVWLERAEHAMDAALSWTCLWDIDLPPGRLRDHAFRSRGWTVVSAQNQHLDVFGVFYTPEIDRMGELLGRPELRQLARLMFRSCGQLIDEFGSQGEQIQQTNFAQFDSGHGDMSDVERMRGGYSEGWTVFWITTHFLHAAARLERW
jgi:hypothetical protein